MNLKNYLMTKPINNKIANIAKQSFLYKNCRKTRKIKKTEEGPKNQESLESSNMNFLEPSENDHY